MLRLLVLDVSSRVLLLIVEKTVIRHRRTVIILNSVGRLVGISHKNFVVFAEEFQVVFRYAAAARESLKQLLLRMDSLNCLDINAALLPLVCILLTAL